MINQATSNASLAGSEISLVDSFFLLAYFTGAEGHRASQPCSLVRPYHDCSAPCDHTLVIECTSSPWRFHFRDLDHASALPHNRHPRAAIALRPLRVALNSSRLSSTTTLAARIVSLPTRHSLYRRRSLFLQTL
ncbi:hypothetical protein M422DRAFT_247404 [Sphaerobolus stellatus SS14]|nr:hypothetical protein M422DRAFT_247398 [Sphaerobolus stellatus SS14]KIJ48555.1 hypothetical protein M422DRAFT_247404 [Sphaerobolus stellatus SS14]